MQAKFANQAVLGILLICQVSACIGTDTPDANQSSKYLNAVREFADNVLKYGRDKGQFLRTSQTEVHGYESL